MRHQVFLRLFSAGFFALTTASCFAEMSSSPANTPENTQVNTKAHSEVLRELYQVVLLKVPQDRAAFGNWVDSLNQGASIEGVYNGFTHSKEYRDLEKHETNVAKPEAVQIFVDQWFYFQRELSKKSELRATDALPLRELGFSELEKSSPAKSSNPSLILSQENVAKSAFSKASVFTLKRVLGNQALLWVAEGRREGENASFPLRYANWVMECVRSKIDFGLLLRNRDDAPFHAQWAARELKSKRGILEWEVLNRIHRMLNSAQAAQKKTPISPAKGANP